MIGNVAVSLIFFSASLTALGGDSERFVGYDGIAKALVGDAVGFFKSRRDGGGGASSASPWFLNWVVCFVAVFGRFSLSLRISIEIDFFFGGGMIPFSCVFSVSSLIFFGILTLANGCGCILANVSLSFSAWVLDASDLLLSLSSLRSLLLELVDFERCLSLSRLDELEELLLWLPLLLCDLLLLPDDECFADDELDLCDDDDELDFL